MPIEQRHVEEKFRAFAPARQDQREGAAEHAGQGHAMLRGKTLQAPALAGGKLECQAPGARLADAFRRAGQRQGRRVRQARQAFQPVVAGAAARRVAPHGAPGSRRNAAPAAPPGAPAPGRQRPVRPAAGAGFRHRRQAGRDSARGDPRRPACAPARAGTPGHAPPPGIHGCASRAAPASRARPRPPAKCASPAGRSRTAAASEGSAGDRRRSAPAASGGVDARTPPPRPGAAGRHPARGIPGRHGS